MPVLDREHLRPAIFGLADGMMSLLGVILYLLGHQSLIFPVAISGAISNALSMAGGEFMSDSDNGLAACIVMGITTGTGAILPAIPFAFTSGPLALAVFVVTCLLIAIVVGALRIRQQSEKITVKRLLPTLALLAVIFGVVIAVSLFLPSPVT